jgi:hypothetical protein
MWGGGWGGGGWRRRWWRDWNWFGLGLLRRGSVLSRNWICSTGGERVIIQNSGFRFGSGHRKWKIVIKNGAELRFRPCDGGDRVGVIEKTATSGSFGLLETQIVIVIKQPVALASGRRGRGQIIVVEKALGHLSE